MRSIYHGKRKSPLQCKELSDCLYIYVTIALLISDIQIRQADPATIG